MRWRGERQSDNVEDRRRITPAGMAVGGGAGTILIVILALLFGADPQALLERMGQNQPAGPPGAQAPAGKEGEEANDEQYQFASTVLAMTEDVWRDVFREMGREYRDPILVPFTKRVESACGMASDAVGPFYCPADQKVYIDLSFYDELAKKFKAPGDFARAYVLAHEVGHHVQNQLGITDKVHRLQGRVPQDEYNQMSVRLELQADFLAGLWANRAHKAKQILEKGDVESALNAASAIGDDRLQRQSQGYVVPDSFTHGTSAQRVRWFRRGLETGDIKQGDTFSATDL